MQTAEHLKFMVVDDDPKFRKLLAVHVSRRGHEVMEVDDSRIALDKLSTDSPDIIITNLHKLIDMERNMSGREFARKVREIGWSGPIMVCTNGDITASYREEVKADGIDLLQAKPYDLAEINQLIDNATNLVLASRAS